MKGEIIYPEWVQEQRVRGTTVKKIGGTYYLYKRTSKRVPGKKYPQPVDTYVGIITPDGVIESKKKKLATTSIEVKSMDFRKQYGIPAQMIGKKLLEMDGKKNWNV